MVRITRLSFLIFLLMLVACTQNDEQKAVQIAREWMIRTAGANAVHRAHVETRLSKTGWLVIFRDAYATSDEGSWWPDACGFGQTHCVYRDVFACVGHDWMIHEAGATAPTVSFENQTVCDADASPTGIVSPAPTITPAPSATHK